MTKSARIVHYVFGMAADFGGKPWSLVHYACLMSAIDRLRPDVVMFHCEFEPEGPWWDLTRPLISLKLMKAPKKIFGNDLLHVAHQAGVVRLQVLIEHGGIYLDADVFVHRSFENLLDHPAVLGIEGKDHIYGMADAVILGHAKSPFLVRWLDSYKSFRSRGRDEFWGEHPVQMPAKLALEYPHEVLVLPYNAFFWPLWTPDHLKWIYESHQPIEPLGYANHLWETLAWPYLADLTPGQVRATATNFHAWIRQYVDDLPNNYGRPAHPTSTPALLPQIVV